MIVGNRLIEAELIKQLPLALVAPPHHVRPPSRIASGKRNHARRWPSTPFCNTIGTTRTSRDVRFRAAIERLADTTSDGMTCLFYFCSWLPEPRIENAPQRIHDRAGRLRIDLDKVDVFRITGRWFQVELVKRRAAAKGRRLAQQWM